MGSASGSSSAATVSCVSARSHSPVTQNIWNRNVRRRGSRGALRTSCFRVSRAPWTSPERKVSRRSPLRWSCSDQHDRQSVAVIASAMFFTRFHPPSSCRLQACRPASAGTTGPAAPRIRMSPFPSGILVVMRPADGLDRDELECEARNITPVAPSRPRSCAIPDQPAERRAGAGHSDRTVGDAQSILRVIENGLNVTLPAPAPLL